MTLKLITAPAVEPITLAEAKLHLRVDAATEDAMITDMIFAARQAAEGELNRALITQTWERVLDAFPASYLPLGMPPVVSVQSVTYIDPAGATQTLSGGAYTLDSDRDPGWLLPAYGTAWPATRYQANAVRVRFNCGYGGTAAAVPQAIRQWLLVRIGTLYQFREAFVTGGLAALPNRFVDGLLDRYRVYA